MILDELKKRELKVTLNSEDLDHSQKNGEKWREREDKAE
jgi:hypothetical protein